MNMKAIPWEMVRRCYETEKKSLRELAEEYGVAEDTLRKRARKERWKTDDGVSSAAAECVSRTVRHLARQLARAENGEEVSLGEIKDLTGVLKDLVKVQESLGDGGDAEGIRVEMSEEVETWSR